MLKSLKELLFRNKREKTVVTNMALYHFPGCPYCKVVSSTIKRLNLQIEQRNIHQKDEFRQELVNGGGKKTVPCLRIEQDNGATIWMYESLDIVNYLRKKFTD